jgi:hypothetical protein
VSKEPIPCAQDNALREKIAAFARDLEMKAHEIASFPIGNEEMHATGIFRGAIERLRGTFSATMGDKRGFTEVVLNFLKLKGSIRDWEIAGSANRYDYGVHLNSGRFAAIESKGCLDGNNTNIFERPARADEFIIWSVCQNPGADPRKNLWSGIHTRLSAEIVSREQVVDGIVVWDFNCGTAARPCPKVRVDSDRVVLDTALGPLRAPPPCIYLMPRTVPSVRSNAQPATHTLQSVEFLGALHAACNGRDDDVNHVSIEARYVGVDTARTTTIVRDGKIAQQSKPTAIKRK